MSEKVASACPQDPTHTATQSKMYFCEDHLDMLNDMENYTEYRVMGSGSQIRMRADCLPSKFGCQLDRKRRTDVKTSRSSPAKRQKLRTIEEYEREVEQMRPVRNEGCPLTLSPMRLKLPEPAAQHVLRGPSTQNLTIQQDRGRERTRASPSPRLEFYFGLLFSSNEHPHQIVGVIKMDSETFLLLQRNGRSEASTSDGSILERIAPADFFQTAFDGYYRTR
ncbi:hypothetical protein EVAR_81408_1 [Eumeta japonica]|uniref:Uncharacterized protein n=1 Tax=Eumeta variegata TaxID=151549 RepID=A0A4C1WEK4_EUMVA|nr:hypothetical protein EVAR_81408_1 [Eumeta japonica]